MPLGEIEQIFVDAAAGTRGFWRVKRLSPGLLEAEMTEGHRRIVVVVQIGEEVYSLRYDSSEKFKATDEEIHKRANAHIKRLDREFRNALATAERRS